MTVGLHSGPLSADGGYVTTLPDVVSSYRRVVFTNSTGIGVEHAAVTLGMATVVYQTPLLPFVKGHVTQGAAVGHLVLHGQVTQDVNVLI